MLRNKREADHMKTGFLFLLFFIGTLGGNCFSKLSSNRLGGSGGKDFPLFFAVNGGIACIFFLLSSGFRLQWEGVTLFFALLYAGVVLLSLYSNMKVLQKMGMKPSDINVYECNEAFAAQNLGVIRQMESMSGETINMDNWNPNGGAIAFGHPNGASGGRIALSALRHMENTQGQFGLISSCCGGGIGVSALFERV